MVPQKQAKHIVGKKLGQEFDLELALQGINAKLDAILEELQTIRQSVGARQNPVQR